MRGKILHARPQTSDVDSIPIARSISLDDSVAFMHAAAESLKTPLEMVGFGRQMDAAINWTLLYGSRRVRLYAGGQNWTERLRVYFEWMAA